MPDLLTHAEQVAREHRVTVRRDRRKAGGGAKAYPGQRLVITYGINGQQDYFTALHEIGHCVLKHHLTDDSQTLYTEAEAWKWAIDNACVRPSVLTRQRIAKCLATYTKKGHPKPPHGHPYHKMMEWAKLVRPSVRTEGRLP